MHILGINAIVSTLPQLTVDKALGVRGGMVSLRELLVPHWSHFTDVGSEVIKVKDPSYVLSTKLARRLSQLKLHYLSMTPQG